MLKQIILTFVCSLSFLTSLSAGVLIKSPPVGYLPADIYLTTPSYHPGFFTAFFTVLGFLEACEKDGRNGYHVDFGDKGNYYEPSIGKNWWSYYFKPISKDGPANSEVRIIKEEEKTYYSFNTLNHNRADVKLLIDKYIQIDEQVQAAVDEFSENVIQGFSLIGVNYQRPERTRVNANRNFSGFFTKIDALLQRDEYFACKIFVSTDDESFLVEMIDRYGSRVIFRDIPRFSDQDSVAYTSLTPNYERGFNEIVECLLLAKCGAIAKTSSHITIAAGFFNPELEFVNVRMLPPPRPKTP